MAAGSVSLGRVYLDPCDILATLVLIFAFYLAVATARRCSFLLPKAIRAPTA